MKIVHVIPGAGGSFYCENCLRDIEMVRALRKMGHDVIVAPMYLPLLYDGQCELGTSPIFYGAINVYMKQVSRLFRRTPQCVQRLLDSSILLKWAATKAGSTRARGHEEMTLSMLRGENGNQSSELDKLVKWLGNEIKPDVVHLSNALLSGLALRIRNELGVPVVCSLQDEDTWVDAMEEEYANEVWDVLAANAAAIDVFTPVSKFYSGIMLERLRVPADRMRVVYPGVDVEEYEIASLDFDPPVIGFLARMTRSLGLDVLVESFIRLKKENGFTDLKLRLAGGNTEDDRPFIDSIMRRLNDAGVAGDVESSLEIDRGSRVAFLKELDLFAVPVRQAQAFGIYVVEALAAGVPVVEPRHGAFPELVGETGSGVLYEPNDETTLTAALDSLLRDPARARELGRSGRKYAVEHLDVKIGAREMVKIYEQAVRVRS